MFQNITQNYTWVSASLEIFIMLFGAFILGLIFWWLIKPTKKFLIRDYIALEDFEKEKTYTKTKKESLKIQTQHHQNENQEETMGDDFSLLQGLTEKVQELLEKNNILTYQDIVDADVEGLEVLLLQAGPAYKRYNPATWPDQARLAMQGKWRELEEYQEILSLKKKKNKS